MKGGSTGFSKHSAVREFDRSGGGGLQDQKCRSALGGGHRGCYIGCGWSIFGRVRGLGEAVACLQTAATQHGPKLI